MKQLMLLMEESQASKEAKAKGLEYMSFGRYGKGGKQTHTVKNGRLVPIASGGKTASGKDVPGKAMDWSKHQQVTGEVPYHKRQGPPEYIGGGPKPLPRTYKGKNIAAGDSAEYMTTGKIKRGTDPNPMTGPGDAMGRALAQGGPQFDSGKSKGRMSVDRQQEAENFWRDAFLKRRGKMSASDVRRIMKIHPLLKKTFGELSGDYIHKDKQGNYEWPEQF